MPREIESTGYSENPVRATRLDDRGYHVSLMMITGSHEGLREFFGAPIHDQDLPHRLADRFYLRGKLRSRLDGRWKQVRDVG